MNSNESKEARLQKSYLRQQTRARNFDSTTWAREVLTDNGNDVEKSTEERFSCVAISARVSR